MKKNKKIKIGKFFINRKLAEILLIAICLWLIFFVTGQVLHRITLGRIAGLTDTVVTAQRIKFRINGVVSIKNLQMSAKDLPGAEAAIFTAGKVYARFGILSILKLNPKIRKLKVSGFTINAQQNTSTGRWNFDCLKSLSPGSGNESQMPIIRLRRGQFLYSQISDSSDSASRIKPIVQIPLDAKFGPSKNSNSYDFSIITANRPPFAPSKLNGRWHKNSITVTGSLSSTDLPAFEKHWNIEVLAAELKYKKGGDYNLALRIKDMYFNNKTNDQNIVAFSPVVFRKSGPFTALGKFFTKYRPSGKVDIDFDLAGSLKNVIQSTATGKIYCRKVSVNYYKFPYAINSLTGTIDLTETSATLNSLKGSHGSTDLVIDGFVKDFGKPWQCDLKITSDNMALDEDLYNAISQKQKHFWSLFSPIGTIKINYHLAKKPYEKSQKTLSIKLQKNKAAFVHYQRPLTNLTGELTIARGEINIKNLTGLLNNSPARLTGTIKTKDVNSPQYNLTLNGDNCQLGSEFFELIPKQFKHFAEPLLNASGVISYQANLNKSANNPFDYKITIDCHKNSIDHAILPFAIKDITGKVTITPGDILLNNIKAKPQTAQTAQDKSQLSLDGKLLLANNRLQSGKTKLTITNLEFNEKLGLSLPKHLSDFYNNISPQGKFDLLFNRFDFTVKENYATDVTFDCQIKISDCQLQTKPKISQLTGLFKINGHFKSDSGIDYGQAQFAIDKFAINERLLTNIKADKIIFLPDYNKWISENLSGNCYDGKITGQLELSLSPDNSPSYKLWTGFEQIDMKRFLLAAKKPGDITSADEIIYGRMSGQLALAGNFNRQQTTGTCTISIVDMQIGRLSPIAKMLYVLNFSEPKDFAFDRLFCDTYIQDGRTFFRQISLSGKAINFAGSGWLNNNTDKLDLTLGASGKKLFSSKPDIINSITTSLSNFLIRMEITGTIGKPIIKLKPWPMLDDTFNLLTPKSRRQNL